MTFFETIRGVEVEIHAEEWDGDESVGIPYGPECVYATRLDDCSDFELTDEEMDRLTIKACEAAYQDVPDYP